MELISSTNRLTRIAAKASGNTTPASQWRILSVLEADGPQRIGEVAAELRISQPAITQFVPALEAQGLLTRTSDPEDARATVLAITAGGSEALADWKVELGGAIAPLFSGLSQDDWRALERTAQLLAAASAVQA
jgi:DNA-binding MarR family transcriptional regulator